MSTFDIRDIEPEGYEVVDYREAEHGEEILGDRGDLRVWNKEEKSFGIYLILRKKWTPKVGEVIAVRDTDSQNWNLQHFQRMNNGMASCSTYSIGPEFSWAQYRKLTPEERGE